MLSETSFRPRISASIRSSMTLRFSRQPVEFVAGAARPAGARRDRRAMMRARGFGHGVDAAQHAARDEQAAGEAQHDHDGDRPAPGREHDVVEPLALVEIAPDQQAETARQAGTRAPARDAPGVGRLGFVEPPVDGFGPARIVEDARRQRGDVAGERLAVKGGDEIEARAGPARARVDDDHQPADAALPVLLGQAGDLGIDGIGDLLGDQPAGVEREIAEQKRREQREHGQIDQRQLERGGAK